MTYQSVFGGNTVYPSDVSLLHVHFETILHDVQLEWPLERGGDTPLARIIEAHPDIAGRKIILPPGNTAGVGETVLFNNFNSIYSFEVDDFLGNITLRYALEESRNIPAIKMMEMLGPKNVLDYAKRFGFEENFPPYLPIALGAGDATLIEVTSAYTAFPNGGIRMKPFMVLNVKDREGNLLEETQKQCRMLELPHPFLTNDDMARLRRNILGDFRACTLRMSGILSTRPWHSSQPTPFAT